MKYCAYCGAGLPDESIFCSQCGKRCIEVLNTSLEDDPPVDNHLRDIAPADVPPEDIVYEDSVSEEVVRDDAVSADIVPGDAASADIAPAEVVSAVRVEQIPVQQQAGSSTTDRSFFSVKKNRVIAVFAVLALVIAAAVLLFAGGSSSGVPDSVMKGRDSIVRIYADYHDGYVSGSGFVIAKEGNNSYIATNAHVVEDNPHTITVVHDKEEITADIFAIDAKKDLCILKTDRPVSAKALTLVTSDIEQGKAVFAAGFPGAADVFSDEIESGSGSITITNGIVSAVRSASVVSYGSPVTLIQINAAINHGNSGGPLFNEKGQVVGVNTFAAYDSQGIFAAIAASELRSFASSHGLNLPARTSSGFPVWVIIAIIAAAALIILLLALRGHSRVTNTDKKIAQPVYESAAVTDVPKKKKRWLIPVAVALVVIIAGLYATPYIFVKSGNYRTAEKFVISRVARGIFDPNLYDRIEAGLYMENGNYSAAENLFRSLPEGYYDSGELANEAMYQEAMQAADNEDWASAKKTVAQLAKIGYKDAEEQSNKIAYREALYYYEVKQDTQSAYIKMKNLAENGYERAVSEAEILQEYLYLEMQANYQAGNYDDALKAITYVKDLADGNKYYLLLEARYHSLRYANNSDSNALKNLVNDIVNIIDFEDAKTVLVINDQIANEFLKGTWKTKTGGYYFKIKKSDTSASSEYNIPWYDSNKKYYGIKEGRYILYNKDIDESGAVKQYKFTVVEKDQIKIYAYKDQKTYTLYR